MEKYLFTRLKIGDLVHDMNTGFTYEVLTQFVNPDHVRGDSQLQIKEVVSSRIESLSVDAGNYINFIIVKEVNWNQLPVTARINVLYYKMKKDTTT